MSILTTTGSGSRIHLQTLLRATLPGCAPVNRTAPRAPLASRAAAPHRAWRRSTRWRTSEQRLRARGWSGLPTRLSFAAASSSASSAPSKVLYGLRRRRHHRHRRRHRRHRRHHHHPRHRRGHRVRPSAAAGCPSTSCLYSTTRGVWGHFRPRCLSLRPISSSNSISAPMLRAWGSWSLIRRLPSCPTCPPIPMRCSRHWPPPSRPMAGLPSVAVSRLGLPCSRRVGAGAHGPRYYSC